MWPRQRYHCWRLCYVFPLASYLPRSPFPPCLVLMRDRRNRELWQNHGISYRSKTSDKWHSSCKCVLKYNEKFVSCCTVKSYRMRRWWGSDEAQAQGVVPTAQNSRLIPAPLSVRSMSLRLPYITVPYGREQDKRSLIILFRNIKQAYEAEELKT